MNKPDKANHVRDYNIDHRGSTEEHQQLVDDLLFALGSRPDVRIWIRPVGFDYSKNIRYGVPGETDLDGIVGPYGRRLAIEVKTGNAKLSQKQELWKAMILKFGGIYIEARSVEQALEDFEKQLFELNWKNGLKVSDFSHGRSKEEIHEWNNNIKILIDRVRATI